MLSVRLTDDEFAALTARATEVGVGPSTLARTFVRQSLAESTTPPPPRADTAKSGQVLHAEEHLTAILTARVEALERWVRTHGGQLR